MTMGSRVVIVIFVGSEKMLQSSTIKMMSRQTMVYISIKLLLAFEWVIQHKKGKCITLLIVIFDRLCISKFNDTETIAYCLWHYLDELFQQKNSSLENMDINTLSSVRGRNQFTLWYSNTALCRYLSFYRSHNQVFECLFCVVWSNTAERLKLNGNLSTANQNVFSDVIKLSSKLI